MINLELPGFLKKGANPGHQAAAEIFRPISRKYDLAEHERPVELDTMASMVEGMADAGRGMAGASGGRGDKKKKSDGIRNGGNMAAVLNVLELCWGDVALTLSIPYQGLGNSAIAAVATDEQLERIGKVWASMAITEPGFGSDSAAVSTTATLDGDEYVINGEKIFVTAGERSDHVVVWASVDKSKGRAAIKSFVVPKSADGFTVERLEHKLGIKASDTAVLRLDNVRVPKENLLGSPEVSTKKGFAGAMATFDNTRPLVAAMAVGCARGALEKLREVLEDAGEVIDYDKPKYAQSAAVAEYLDLESDWEAAYLLTLRAAWMADNKKPNTKEASIAKAKAGRVGTHVTLKAVELAGPWGYSERELLEKWGRDSKILDIFEGTQQIQQLVVARRELGLSSKELK
ncbi:acyl-CoA dehydrogenase family protein [Corynebacterium pseudokroppenstedtii]|uniref:Acyl-CoA dehydrogenase family protein n=1 Tax=Corynebacterium pseudokroppenstedtii TaxID=2804917 RepID=A0AAU0PWF2_9CORY|nr:acyl-CoA dehydrogenase family protein [Corynebacterium pseudokroppenstedtii]QRP14010.1 acyl-CoA dehydrogenase family protein [Corynebacterium kroppenstedtii]MBY0791459.1 acyl-CoA dehydrogenase family protein [Corynebacterium pseudokroppenstedtii]MCF6794005.1 acyl-CoA dehydrogenase family protein [Corynebacterium pseudokroppenstedtii]MCF8703473.1 acyl-CoA dehydrogenase family protein [Corynebacterium pseudokroppenstedtii]MCG2636993.1 acyl-CoA dehydrogenase family protein [Corynebacterium pse